MNIQPLLTDFPSTTFATSKRVQQAAIRRKRREMIAESPSGYGVIFGDVLPPQTLAEFDPTCRQRQFGHVPMLWAWTAQILDGNEACSRGLGYVQSWSAARGMPAPTVGTGAFCRARSRMSEEFIGKCSRRVDAAMAGAVRDEDRWQGFTLKAIDGSSVKLMDTPENQEAFPQPTEQKPGCGFPVMSVSGLLNLSHGGWEDLVVGKLNDSDATLALGLMDHLGEGDLLLADRAYCSYRLMAGLRERGAHGVMRLHQRRESVLDWRKGKWLGAHERLVTWRRPMFSNVSKSMTRAQWEALPEQLELRLIRLGCEDRQGKRRSMTVATTLTDHRRDDGIELHALYARRWEIELRLRDIKTTLDFEMIRARAPEMAVKTLSMIRFAYNLLRWVIQRAAITSGRPVTTVSFKGALHLLGAMHESFLTEVGKPRRRASRLDMLIELASRRRIEPRPGRSEPRAVKRRPKPFALLTSPRHEFVETPHRSNYRKDS